MRQKTVLSLAFNLWLMERGAGAQCTAEQQQTCKLSVLDDTMPSSGRCEAKSYVAFTHNCFRKQELPVIDFCCCLHPAEDGVAMCCRYTQSWNYYRCVETTDRINPASATNSLNLPVLLPSILGPALLLLFCLFCCLKRCGYDRYEDEEAPPKRYKLCCVSSWNSEDLEITKQRESARPDVCFPDPLLQPYLHQAVSCPADTQVFCLCSQDSQPLASQHLSRAPLEPSAPCDSAASDERASFLNRNILLSSGQCSEHSHQNHRCGKCSGSYLSQGGSRNKVHSGFILNHTDAFLEPPRYEDCINNTNTNPLHRVS